MPDYMKQARTILGGGDDFGIRIEEINKRAREASMRGVNIESSLRELKESPIFSGDTSLYEKRDAIQSELEKEQAHVAWEKSGKKGITPDYKYAIYGRKEGRGVKEIQSELEPLQKKIKEKEDLSSDEWAFFVDSYMGVSDEEKETYRAWQKSEYEAEALASEFAKGSTAERIVSGGTLEAGVGLMSVASRALPPEYNEYWGGVQDKYSRALDEASGIAHGETGAEWEKMARGSFRNVAEMAVVGSISGPYGSIMYATATEADQAEREATRAGLTGWDKALYVGEHGLAEGGIASIFQALGAGGAETLFGKLGINGARDLFKSEARRTLGTVFKGVLAEEVEEVLTETTHSFVRYINDLDPDAMNLDNLMKVWKQTIIQTGMMMGMGESIHLGQASINKYADRDQRRKDAVDRFISEPSRKNLKKLAPEVRDSAKELGINTSTELGRKQLAATMAELRTTQAATEATTPPVSDSVEETVPQVPETETMPETAPTFTVEGAIAQRMNHAVRKTNFSEKMTEGKKEVNIAIEEAGKYADETGKDAVFVGIDSMNQKKINDFFGDEETADKEALAPMADILHEEFSKIGADDIQLHKVGGDEFGITIIGENISDEQIADTVKVAEGRFLQMLESKGINLNEANARAPKPTYKPDPNDPESVAEYEKATEKYLRSTGFGFRVGIEGLDSGSTLADTWGKVAEDHAAQKKEGRDYELGKLTEDNGATRTEGKERGVKKESPGKPEESKGEAEAEPTEVAPTEGISALTDEENERLKAARKRFLGGGRAMMGLDPGQLAAGAEMGVLYFKAGYRTFKAWSAQMISDLGDKIKPHLSSMWKNMQADRDAILANENEKQAPPALQEAFAEQDKAIEEASPPNPPDSAIPNANEPNDEPTGDILDNWFANKDEAIQEANIDAANIQDAIRELNGEKKFGPKSQETDMAIQLYIDLKGKADEQIAKFGDKLTPEQKKLVERSQNLTEEETAIADKIIEMNERSGKLGLDADVLRNIHANYTMRLWEKEPKGKKAFQKKFGATTARAKRRVFESMLEGWAKGKELQIKGATNAMAVAREQVARAIEDKKLLDLAEKSGIISAQQMEDDWIQVEHPNFRKWKKIGKAEPGKVYGVNTFVSEDGDLFESQPMYAEPTLGKTLNNVLGRSRLYDIPGVETLTKWNAIIKKQLLFTSLFHHQAYLRSYSLGSRGIDPIAGYKAGMQAIKNFTQELRDLVRAGLTVGKIQDFDELASREKTTIGEMIDKVPGPKHIKDALVKLRDNQTDFLFKKLGPALKVHAAILDYQHLLKKHEKKIESGEMSRHDLAKMAANLANDDFGGLHLGRMGRNPTAQHVFRLLALAPDWTESNVRSMVKAFKGGEEGSVYRAFWGRVLLKAAASTVLFNLAMSLGGDDDEDFMEKYKRAWEEGNLRWMDIDVTRLHRLLGGDDKKRKYFSLIGHLKDPVKFVLHPIRSAKHKGSVVTRIVHDALTGVDWRGRPFTNWEELLGVDDKGRYKTSRVGRYRKGEKKGGKLAGQTVRKTLGGGGTLEYGQIPSYLLYETRGTLPIQMQNALGYLSGEMDGFDAITKGLGLMTSSTHPKKGK